MPYMEGKSVPKLRGINGEGAVAMSFTFITPLAKQTGIRRRAKSARGTVETYQFR